MTLLDNSSKTPVHPKPFSGAQEIASGLIIFRRNREGLKFLLLYHGNGYWNFPKGKLEKEERSFRAALREVREETGLAERDLKIVRNFKAYERFSFRRNRQKIFKIVILYLAETDKHRIRISDEHSGYGWFSFSESRKLLAKYKENLMIVSNAYAFLEKLAKTKDDQNKKRRS